MKDKGGKLAGTPFVIVISGIIYKNDISRK